MSKFSGEFPGGVTWDQAILEAARQEATGLPPARYGFHHLVGELDSVTTTMTDVQIEGGETVLPVTAGQVSVVSSSTDDALGGPGAQVVLVRGVGANFAGNPAGLWQDEIVFMNGTTPVLTAQSYLRAFYGRVVLAGLPPGNLGNIDFSIGGNIQARIGFDPTIGIARGKNVTTSSKFAVPQGWTAHLRNIWVGWGENQQVSVWLTGLFGGVAAAALAPSISVPTTVPVGMFPLPPGVTLGAKAVRSSGSGGVINVVSPVLLVRNGV